MNIAVLTLCRDRLAYTQHCFTALHENAGCDFDHFVLDQASCDGTYEWLRDEYKPHVLVGMSDNVGIWAGFNTLHHAGDGRYDVYVTFDNDCELLTPGTLRDVSRLALDHDLVLSPRILGLRNPPPAIGSAEDGIELTSVIGNIFMAIPAWVLDERRFDETRPVWGGDEVPFAEWMRKHGSGVGYVTGYEANHYLTTAGQQQDDPAYWERKVREMASA